ncbi:MAG: hypothetical protein IPH59_16485 [bacterium]|nr:hypothetical protein [bacterium]
MLLTAPSGELAHRLLYRNDRPLLEGTDAVAKLAEIESRRREVWATITNKIDTSGLSPLEVSELVLHSYREWIAS